VNGQFTSDDLDLTLIGLASDGHIGHIEEHCDRYTHVKIYGSADCYELITKLGLSTENLEKEQRCFSLVIGLR